MIRSAFLLAALTLPLVSQVAVAQASSISDFARYGIQAQVTKKTDPRLKNLEYAEDQYYLEVNLGRLSRTQFDAMKAHFKNVSQVPYNPKKEYDLTDFLHPAIQATVNQVYLPKSYNTEKLFDVETDDDSMMFIHAARKSGISSSSNCWNTTAEILRLEHEGFNPNKSVYRLYWPGRWDANDWFTDEKFSSVVNERAILPGDVLVVKQKNSMMDESYMLQHTAIVLSSSLVFEKTDTSENDPYRISFRRDVEAKYRKVFSDDERLIELRRFTKGGENPFSAPVLGVHDLTPAGRKLVKKLVPNLPLERLTSGCETGLGGGCDVIINEVHEPKLIINSNTGRGILYGKRDLLDRFVPLKGSN